ncbi:hypothetical protein BH10ACT1_BH10ACT1_33970 [soil metagenome]
MLLGAALIVRDEAEHLARCLTSLADLVDEVVVVDTGSVDDSVRVAESLGARVLHRPWDGDFSAARNLGLDAVTADWVLYIDADEHVRPMPRAELADALADPGRSHLAHRVWLQARHGFTPYREYRIWRNRADVRFHGVIHESITRDLFRISAAEDLAIGEVDLYLEHEGYEGDLSAKHRRNLPLLREQVLADPTRVYLWGEIGRSHAGLGQIAEAEAAWEEGLARLRAHGPASSADCLALVDLIALRAESGRPDAALVAEADALFPDNALILWAGSIDAAARQDHVEVVRRLDRLLDGDHPDLSGGRFAVDQRIVGHWGHHARGLARFHLGDHVGAAADFRAAERDAPDVEEYAVKRRLAEARARA